MKTELLPTLQDCFKDRKSMGELVTLHRRPLSPVGRLSQHHGLSCPSVLPASAPGHSGRPPPSTQEASSFQVGLLPRLHKALTHSSLHSEVEPPHMLWAPPLLQASHGPISSGPPAASFQHPENLPNPFHLFKRTPHPSALCSQWLLPFCKSQESARITLTICPLLQLWSLVTSVSWSPRALSSCLVPSTLTTLPSWAPQPRTS